MVVLLCCTTHRGTFCYCCAFCCGGFSVAFCSWNIIVVLFGVVISVL